MRLRVALLTTDNLYASRLVQRFQEKYSAILEMSQFSNADSALRNLEANRTDVLLCDGMTLPEPLPRGCIAIELTESTSRATREDRCLLKYQRAEDIYKSMLSRVDGTLDMPAGERTTGIMVFLSPAGGCGSSTAAVTAALYFTRQGKQVLYIDCDPFSDPAAFFPETTQGMRQLLLGLKRRSDNTVNLLLESVVSTSPEKVNYIGTTTQPEDLLTVTGDLSDFFLRQTVDAGKFDWIILDLPAYPSETVQRIMQLANYLIVISDGSTRANLSLSRFHAYLQNLDERQGSHLCRHLRLLYNRFSSRNSKEYTASDIPGLGGFGRVENGNPMDIVRILADQLPEKTQLNELRPSAL